MNAAGNESAVIAARLHRSDESEVTLGRGCIELLPLLLRRRLKNAQVACPCRIFVICVRVVSAEKKATEIAAQRAMEHARRGARLSRTARRKLFKDGFVYLRTTRVAF
jgi:hypothetical protein